jgi:hypothetical protein
LERRVQGALGLARTASSEHEPEEEWRAAAEWLAATNPAAWGEPTDVIDVGVDVDPWLAS